MYQMAHKMLKEVYVLRTPSLTRLLSNFQLNSSRLLIFTMDQSKHDTIITILHEKLFMRIPNNFLKTENYFYNPYKFLGITGEDQDKNM